MRYKNGRVGKIIEKTLVHLKSYAKTGKNVSSNEIIKSGDYRAEVLEAHKNYLRHKFWCWLSLFEHSIAQFAHKVRYRTTLLFCYIRNCTPHYNGTSQTRNTRKDYTLLQEHASAAGIRKYQ